MQVAWHQLLQGVFGVGSLESQHPHMGDVEHAHAVAYGFVFLNQATELHWHLPASEGHHSATSSAAELIERRTQHGFGRRVGEEQFYGVLQLVEAKPEISCSSWSISGTVLNLKTN